MNSGHRGHKRPRERSRYCGHNRCPRHRRYPRRCVHPRHCGYPRHCVHPRHCGHPRHNENQGNRLRSILCKQLQTSLVQRFHANSVGKSGFATQEEGAEAPCGIQGQKSLSSVLRSTEQPFETPNQTRAASQNLVFQHKRAGCIAGIPTKAGNSALGPQRNGGPSGSHPVLRRAWHPSRKRAPLAIRQAELFASSQAGFQAGFASPSQAGFQARFASPSQAGLPAVSNAAEPTAPSCPESSADPSWTCRPCRECRGHGGVCPCPSSPSCRGRHLASPCRPWPSSPSSSSR